MNLQGELKVIKGSLTLSVREKNNYWLFLHFMIWQMFSVDKKNMLACFNTEFFTTKLILQIRLCWNVWGLKVIQKLTKLKMHQSGFWGPIQDHSVCIFLCICFCLQFKRYKKMWVRHKCVFLSLLFIVINYVVLGGLFFQKQLQKV